MSHSKLRNKLKWGKNTTAGGKVLSKTKWLSIREMSTPHIKAVLRTQHRISPQYRDTFEKELIYRQGVNKLKKKAIARAKALGMGKDTEKVLCDLAKLAI